jgi:hypothetical protein
VSDDLDLNGRLQAGIEQAQRGETHDLGSLDEQVRVAMNPDGLVEVRMPEVACLAADIPPLAFGLTPEWALELFQALGQALCTHEETEYDDSWYRLDQGLSAEAAQEFARTNAHRQVIRAFADGSEWIGPWLRFDPETKEQA